MLDLDRGDLDGERLCRRPGTGGGKTCPLPGKCEALAGMERTGMDRQALAAGRQFVDKEAHNEAISQPDGFAY